MPDDIKQAQQFIKQGKPDQAHALLLDHLKASPEDDEAWYWMSKVVATDDLREECLHEALKFNPKNKAARAALDKMKGASSVPVGKRSMAESAAPRSMGYRPNTIPFAIALFVLALIVGAVTYLFTREDLTYRNEGRVVSATVIKLNKEPGSDGQPDGCRADYQFMAYGALRTGTGAIPCADWDKLDDSHRLQIQYLDSQPDRSRVYPPAQTTERYAVIGFGLAALLILAGIGLIVWRFWPRQSTP